VTVRRAAGGLLALAVMLTGCSAEHGAPPQPPRSPVPTEIPAYDASLPPAQAVLALVPLRARVLRVVDLAQVRRQVGLPELTSHSSASDRAAFWLRASTAAPLLHRTVLRTVDGRLRTAYGFGVDDVSWEAHFSGDGSRGWVLSLRPAVDMGAVTRAVAAGVGPLRKADVDAAAHLVMRGSARPGEPVWGTDPAWARLVAAPGEAFLVRRGCLPSTGPQASRMLEPLSGFAVTFGDHVATVRVDRDRSDLFARARSAAGPFTRVFRHPVADPSSGRIGYDVPRPARAAALVRKGVLPFGACSRGD